MKKLFLSVLFICGTLCFSMGSAVYAEEKEEEVAKHLARRIALHAVLEDCTGSTSEKWVKKMLDPLLDPKTSHSGSPGTLCLPLHPVSPSHPVAAQWQDFLNLLHERNKTEKQSCSCSSSSALRKEHWTLSLLRLHLPTAPPSDLLRDDLAEWNAQNPHNQISLPTLCRPFDQNRWERVRKEMEEEQMGTEDPSRRDGIFHGSPNRLLNQDNWKIFNVFRGSFNEYVEIYRNVASIISRLGGVFEGRIGALDEKASKLGKLIRGLERRITTLEEGAASTSQTQQVETAVTERIEALNVQIKTLEGEIQALIQTQQEQQNQRIKGLEEALAAERTARKELERGLEIEREAREALEKRLSGFLVLLGNQ